MNTVFADGPRQVVNAITLYSVMQMDLLPGGENAEKSSDKPAAVQFFENVRILAVNNNLRAVVLIGMLFTLVVWVLSVIKLIIAIALYLIFLFHHIPSRDGTLTAYCRRKINTRVMRVVKQKVNKALAKGVVLQDRAPTQPNVGSDMRPTLPTVNKEDKEPIVTTISRTTTQNTLPTYGSRPGTAAPDRNPTLPDLAWSDDEQTLGRTATESSAYSESAALAGNPATSGFSPLDGQSSPAPLVPPLPPLPNIPPMRSNTPMSRPLVNQPRFNPTPTGTAHSTPGQGYRGMTEGPGYNAYMPSNSPAAVPPHSMTPGVAVTGPEMNQLARTFSPAAQGTTPHPGYPINPFNPISRSVSPGAPVAYPERTLTPMNYNPAGVHATGSVPGRSVSPVARNGTPQAQQPVNYMAFEPSMASQTPIQRSNSPAYIPFPGQDAASPLNDYRRGPSPGPMHSSQARAQAPTPMQGTSMRPYRSDANF